MFGQWSRSDLDYVIPDLHNQIDVNVIGILSLYCSHYKNDILTITLVTSSISVFVTSMIDFLIHHWYFHCGFGSFLCQDFRCEPITLYVWLIRNFPVGMSTVHIYHIGFKLSSFPNLIWLMISLKLNFCIHICFSVMILIMIIFFESFVSSCHHLMFSIETFLGF